MPLDPPSFQGFLIFATGTPAFVPLGDGGGGGIGGNVLHILVSGGVG